MPILCTLQGAGFHGYLCCFFLQSQEVEERDVDQVGAVHDGQQPPLGNLLVQVQQTPCLLVLTKTENQEGV